jgi:hypothetical protein
VYDAHDAYDAYDMFYHFPSIQEPYSLFEKWQPATKTTKKQPTQDKEQKVKPQQSHL